MVFILTPYNSSSLKQLIGGWVDTPKGKIMDNNILDCLQRLAFVLTEQNYSDSTVPLLCP